MQALADPLHGSDIKASHHMAIINLPEHGKCKYNEEKVPSKNLDKSYYDPSCTPIQVTNFVQMLIGKKQESTDTDFQESTIHKEFAFSF